ncbi:MAG: type II toxin-antitoxin system RelE/ParE family toxin [Gammaproteobacteria bacterium]
MIEVYTTEEFDSWLAKLRDRKARARIQARIDRVELGNFGDVASVGDGVSELRIFYGPGYRIYFTKQSSVVVVLLVGGDKSSQSSDIEKAKKLAANLEI